MCRNSRGEEEREEEDTIVLGVLLVGSAGSAVAASVLKSELDLCSTRAWAADETEGVSLLLMDVLLGLSVEVVVAAGCECSPESSTLSLRPCFLPLASNIARR